MMRILHKEQKKSNVFFFDSVDIFVLALEVNGFFLLFYHSSYF